MKPLISCIFSFTHGFLPAQCWLNAICWAFICSWTASCAYFCIRESMVVWMRNPLVYRFNCWSSGRSLLISASMPKISLRMDSRKYGAAPVFWFSTLYFKFKGSACIFSASSSVTYSYLANWPRTVFRRAKVRSGRIRGSYKDGFCNKPIRVAASG